MSQKRMIPGEYALSAESVVCNENPRHPRQTIKLTVKNTGDRPIQVGSHTHFFEVNKALDFKRSDAFGYRLNIAAGTAIRFEPGDEKELELVQLGGTRVVYGFNALTMGSVDSPWVKQKALEKAKKLGFKGA
ncbi:MAG: urease subunit beta [Candidatus Bathyarchaeia archaeon]